MMLASKLLDERNPELAVMLKFLELERVDDVSQIARNHDDSLED